MDTESWSTSESVAAVAGGDGRPSGRPALFERGVYRRLLDEGYRFRFFQAVRLLELMDPDAPGPGETVDRAADRIRLRPSVDLVFPATDVKRVEPLDEERMQVVVTFMGLYGVDSPLPYYFYDELATEGEHTFAHRDFLDIFNHRLYAFFYRAWKKYRPGLHFRSNGEDRYAHHFLSLAGLGTPHAADDLRMPSMRFASQAGLLGPRVRNAVGLERLIASLFEPMPTRVIENVPRWVSIPSRQELGSDGFRLGENATIGEQIYDRSGKFRIRLGPMGIENYLALLPGGEMAETLRQVVRMYAPDYLDFDVELQVRAHEMPSTQLGDDAVKLGLTTCLGQPAEPVLSRVVTYEA